MMYFLLVEAAGIRQLERIHADRYRTIVSELEGTLDRFGFGEITRDGDLLLYGARPEIKLEPPVIAALGRTVLSALRGRMEDLLDFLIVIDYRDGAVPPGLLVKMERLLRFARSSNAVYATEPVVQAISPMVETVPEGELNRIVAFLGEGTGRDVSYRDELLQPELAGRIVERMRSHRAAHIWIVAPDTSIAAVSLESAVSELAPAARQIVIQCRPESTSEEILQGIVAGLPGEGGGVRESRGGESLEDHAARAVAILKERFSHPTTHLLSEGWRIGELSLVLARHLNGPSSGADPCLVILRDLDRSRPTVVGAVLSSLDVPGTESVDRNLRIIVTARASMTGVTGADFPYSRWEELFVGATVENSERYDAALSFWRRPGREATSLPENHRRTLYLLSRLRGTLDEAALNHFFPPIGITLAERARIFSELEDQGYLCRLWTMEVHPGVDELVEALVTDADRRAIDGTIVEILEGQLRAGALSLSPSLWGFLDELMDGAQRTERRHSFLHNLAGGAAFTAMDRVLAHRPGTDGVAKTSEASARIRLYLRDSRGPQECAADYQVVQAGAADESVPDPIRADFLLSAGEYLLATRDYPAALKAAKGATILSQNGATSAVGASHLLMARVLLAQHRLADAGQYLTFAREEARRDRSTELVARTLEAVRLFLVGNLSRATVQFSSLEEPLLRDGFSEWLLLAWFALGRIDFELGEYRRAAARFGMVADWAMSCGMEQPARTVRAWTRRAETLGEERASEVPTETADLTAEELLFAAEGLIRDGVYEEALVLLERAEARELTVDRWPRLGVCWDNGFASMEDLMIADRPGSSELLRIIRAFRAWMLAVAGRQDEAVPLFYRLTRGNEGLSVDPYAGLYNYLYSIILPRERSSDRDDRITVLGKSVKLVQERMSRMDDYRDKQRFLRDNTWNRRLMESARRHNLV
jgi:tetratricopeptide (TPR) repeat protein